MKNKIKLIFLLFLYPFFCYGQTADDLLNKHEYYRYSVELFFIKIAEASIKVDAETIYYVENQPCYHIVVDAHTTGLLSLTAKVKDRWESFVDKNKFYPRKFYRNINEGSYHCNETSIFKQEKGIVHLYKKTEKKQEKIIMNIPNNTQDLVTGFFYMRKIDFSHINIGDTICMDAFLEAENFAFKIIYKGKENIKTNFGVMSAIKLLPIIPKNDLFSEGTPITVWLSNDKNKVPLKLKLNFFLGNIVVELDKYTISN